MRLFMLRSTLLPATAPPAAPSTVIAARPVPWPNWLPTTPPSTPPITAPLPVPGGRSRIGSIARTSPINATRAGRTLVARAVGGGAGAGGGATAATGGAGAGAESCAVAGGAAVVGRGGTGVPTG